MSGEKLRALVLTLVMVFAVPAGVMSFAGTAGAANTAGNVSLSINAAGNQATITVDDADLNTAGNSPQSIVVNVNSTSENATSRADRTSSDTEGGTQDVTISPGSLVYDRTRDGQITAADFTLLGAPDESISSVSSGQNKYTVTINDPGDPVDGNPETVSYTKLSYRSLSSDTDTQQQVTTSSPVGDRDLDGDIDKNDIKFVSNASTESITNFNHNADGTATFDIVDSSDSDGAGESFTYLPTETAVLTETSQSTGKFKGTIPLQTGTDSAGVLKVSDGDTVNATYWEDGTTGKTAQQSYSSGGGGSNTFINGTVTNKSGSTIDGAMAVAIPESGGTEITDKTDANGDYSLGVSAGTSYEVIVDDHPDHPFKVKSGISVTQSNTKTVDFQLKELPGKGFLNGTVLNSNGNAVGSGVSVSARDMGYRFSGTTTTDANGEFSLKLSAADYIVRAKGPNSPPQSIEDITVNEGQTTQVTLQLPQTGYISGTVEDASGNAQKQVGVVADSGDQVVFDRTNKNGKYKITAPTGNFTVSVFAKGQDAASQQVTVTDGNTVQSNFTLKKTKVTHSSVEVVSGSGVQTNDLGIRSALQMGMLRVKLVNESKSGTQQAGGAPHELENLGVTDSTKFRMNITVTNFTASSLMWGIDDARWSTSQNASNPNATDITVTGTPTQIQVNFGKKGGVETGIGPLMFKDPSQVSWPGGRDDRATAGRNKTVYFSIFDLSNMPGAVQNRMSGMSVTTNAQRFSTPTIQNNSLRVWVAAPTKTVAGTDHNGFYQAEIPDSQLTEWGVDDPESELEALYKGDPANFTVTNTDTGARIRLDNISYSAGYAEVKANPTAGNSGNNGGGGGGGGASPSQTTATVEQESESSGDQANDESTDENTDGTTVTIDHVTTDDPTVSVPVEEETKSGIAVEKVSTSFDMGTSVDNEMTVDASSSAPASVPESDGGDVLGYVSVEVEGNLADRVAEGSFTVELDEAELSNVDPADVTAQRYHDGEWQTVETQPINGSAVEVITPGFSTFALTAEQTTTPVAETETPTTTPTATANPTPTATANPTPTLTPESTPVSQEGTVAVETETPTDTPAPTTPTPGGSGPGFGVVVAVLALIAVATARLRR